MKRRTFIKLLSGFLSMGALPVLAKPKTIVFDGVDSILKPENDPVCGGFTLGTPRHSGDPLDDYQIITKVFDGKKSKYIDHSEFINQHNVFAPNDLPNITMWQGFETDEHGVTRYIDKLTGEDLSENIKRFNGDIKIPE